jgi:PP-loop superfamily ATP-utilizing enzyme
VILEDRRIKAREIAGTIGISKEVVGYILSEDLDMKKSAQDVCRACSQQIKNALAV